MGEHSLLLDSSIPLALLPMVTRRSSTVSVMLRSSTAVSPCLPLLDTLSKRPVSAFQAIPAGGLVQLLFLIGVLEASIMKDVAGTAEFVGDFRNGAIDYGWDTFDEETKLQKRAIELN